MDYKAMFTSIVVRWKVDMFIHVEKWNFFDMMFLISKNIVSTMNMDYK